MLTVSVFRLNLLSQIKSLYKQVPDYAGCREMAIFLSLMGQMVLRHGTRLVSGGYLACSYWNICGGYVASDFAPELAM